MSVVQPEVSISLAGKVLSNQRWKHVTGSVSSAWAETGHDLISICKSATVPTHVCKLRMIIPNNLFAFFLSFPFLFFFFYF